MNACFTSRLMATRSQLAMLLKLLPKDWQYAALDQDGGAFAYQDCPVLHVPNSPAYGVHWSPNTGGAHPLGVLDIDAAGPIIAANSLVRRRDLTQPTTYRRGLGQFAKTFAEATRRALEERKRHWWQAARVSADAPMHWRKDERGRGLLSFIVILLCLVLLAHCAAEYAHTLKGGFQNFTTAYHEAKRI